MPAYKDEKQGTWYVQFYYTDWDGKKKKKWKRGFKTKIDINVKACRNQDKNQCLI